ncbi:hypothetical protein BCR34DRAFT_366051 [Clohesyomyces aquaticus]|uniref:C2H2-type domain-containing protein n=1 Tax=Clohesyomyces aquaticus TaxID=1231657 RepID=A0A1Y1ZHN6_9PLEO|nr:hypothetical protein BCR34DRAFT_366051 [Clohesyomyces aquaticus]
MQAAQYQDAVRFLRSLKTTLDSLETYIQQNPDGTHKIDIEEQLGRLNKPWKEFEKKVAKYEPSLAENPTKSKLRQVPQKIAWGLKVDEAVRRLKEAIMQPLQAINLSLSLAVLESLNNSTEAPWADRCRQLVDAIHLAAIPQSLSKEVSSLQEASEELKELTKAQLERLEGQEKSLGDIRNNLITTIQRKDEDRPEPLYSEVVRTVTGQLEKLIAVMTRLDSANNKEDTVAARFEQKIKDLQHALREEIGCLKDTNRTTRDTFAEQRGTLRAQSTATRTVTLSFGHLIMFVGGALAGAIQSQCQLSTSKGCQTGRSVLRISKTQDQSISRSTRIKRKKQPGSKTWSDEFRELQSKSAERSGRDAASQDPREAMKYRCPYDEANHPPFTSLDALETHIWKYHNANDSARNCPKKYCDKTFWKTDNLTKHLREKHNQGLPSRKIGSRLTPDITLVVDPDPNWPEGTVYCWYCCCCYTGHASWLGVCPHCNIPRCHNCPIEPMTRKL